MLGNNAHKSFIETNFSHSKDAKNTWLACDGYLFAENPATLSTTEIYSRKEIVNNERNALFMERLPLTSSPVIDNCLTLLRFAYFSDTPLMILSSCPLTLQNTTR